MIPPSPSRPETLRAYVQHKLNCAINITRQADDSAAYLSEKCTCGLDAALAGPQEPTSEPPRHLCRARRYSGPDLMDCDWPFCGCCPIAEGVIQALQECNMLKDRDEPLPAGLQASSGWQPIETAPKDGTSVLAWRDSGVHVMRWKRLGDDGFWDEWHVKMNHLSQPTHWMPLPASPSASTEQK